MTTLHKNAVQLILKELSHCLVDAIPVDDAEFIGHTMHRTRMGTNMDVLTEGEVETIQELHHKHVKGQND